MGREKGERCHLLCLFIYTDTSIFCPAFTLSCSGDDGEGQLLRPRGNKAHLLVGKIISAETSGCVVMPMVPTSLPG